MDGIETSLRPSTMSAINQAIYPRKVEGLTVHGLRGNKLVKLPPAFSTQLVPVNKENIPTPDTAIKWPHLRHLASKILQDVEVGLLIRNDCPLALSPTSPKDFIRSPESGGPFAQKSVLDLGIIGCTTPLYDSATCHDGIMWHNGYSKSGSSNKGKRSLCPEERSFIWDNGSEDLNCDKISYQDAKILEKVNSKTAVNKSGHYEMPLPLNGDEPMAKTKTTIVSM